MPVNNLAIVLIYRIVLVIAAGLGLAYGLGLPYGYCNWDMFVYYTLLSNFLCFVFFCAALIFTLKQIKRSGLKGDATLWPRFKGGLTVIITITFLVYCCILAPRIQDPAYNPHTASNLLLHYITPIMALLDWFIFDDTAAYRRYDPLLWLAGPFAYLLFILIRAALCGEIGNTGSRYPYFFINMDVLESWRFILYIICCALLFAALGYVLLLVAKFTRKSRQP